MTYLNPPPAPAPVVVTKDYGGLVTDYQAQTAYYRQTDREVRVHECHSACTLALSLPNVCVYPDSIFKFHQAYNENNKQTDLGVSEQLFDSYPVAVRARLGTLTRRFKILTGSQLIALGIRDCNTPRIMVASTTSPAPTNVLGHVWSNVMSAFGTQATGTPTRHTPTTVVATREQTEAEKHLREEAVFASVPLPPPRPKTSEPAEGPNSQVPNSEVKVAEAQTSAPASQGQGTETEKDNASAPSSSQQPSQQRPASLSVSFTRKLPPIPQVIEGAQPILPPHFLAYAMIARLSR